MLDYTARVVALGSLKQEASLRVRV
jgi:hypothetical protein